MAIASELIREARLRAELTQSELAHRTGIKQNVISDYERARREPSFRVVDLILNATGFVLEYAPATTLRTLRQNRGKILDLLAAHGAHNVCVFGSVAREEDQPDSDVDLLIDLAPDATMFKILRMQAEVEAIVGRTVDLVPRGSLKPLVRETTERDAVPL